MRIFTVKLKNHHEDVQPEHIVLMTDDSIKAFTTALTTVAEFNLKDGNYHYVSVTWCFTDCLDPQEEGVSFPLKEEEDPEIVDAKNNHGQCIFDHGDGTHDGSVPKCINEKCDRRVLYNPRDHGHM